MIKMYPLRFDPSCRKIRSTDPVPWVNLYFLVCPKLVRAVGDLESAGWIRAYEKRLEAEETLMAEFEADHEAYAVERWGLLTAADKAYAAKKRFEKTLRGTGVCGMTYRRKIKCLHAQYAYHLAREGGTVVGRWVDEQLLAES